MTSCLMSHLQKYFMNLGKKVVLYKNVDKLQICMLESPNKMGWNKLLETDNAELIKLRECTATELEVYGWFVLLYKSSKHIRHVNGLKNFPSNKGILIGKLWKLAILFDETDTFETSLKIGAIIDCYFNIYMYSKEKSLSDVELLNILKLQTTLLKNCENEVDLDGNLEVFRESLKEKGGTDEPFRVEKLKNVIDYILQSFFQHYELYHLMFTQPQAVQDITKEIIIEVVPTTQLFPPPLEESINKEWYDLYVDPSHEQLSHDGNTEEASGDAVVELDKQTSSGEHVGTDTAEYLLSHVSQDEMKELITKVAQEKLAAARLELESKINDKETLLLKSLNQLQIS